MAKGRYQFLFDQEERAGKRVFHDPTRTRQTRLRRMIIAVALIAIAWMALFFGSSLTLPGLVGEVQFWVNVKLLHRLEPGEGHADHGQVRHATVLSTGRGTPVAHTVCRDRSTPAFAASAEAAGTHFYAHMPTELAGAPLSLNRSCDVFDVLMPDWFTVKTKAGALFLDAADSNVREEIETFRKTSARPPQLMPTVILEMGTDPEAFFTEMTTPETQERLTGALVSAAKGLKTSGACLDFNQLDETQLRTLAPLFTRVTDALHAVQLKSCLVISSEQNIWDDGALTRAFDNVVVKAFREPWVGSPPRPLADDAWFADLASRSLAAIGPDRLTLAIGNFATDWTTGKPLPTTMPVAEAMRRLADAKAELTFSPETGNSFSAYRDARGSHRMWMLDAASARNQLLTARGLGIRNVGVWSLGSEDPGLMAVLNDEDGIPARLAAELTEMTLPDYVSYTGEGPFLRILERPQTGYRRVDMDPETGRIRDVSYLRLPKPYELERYGAPAANKLVLTFDDGPDPRYTPEILDVLKSEGVSATFFVVGAQVMDHADLLNRIIDEGHEIGSHTFYHPRMDKISHSRAQMEISMTSKVIAGYTGHTTKLYREPFLRSGGPISADRVGPLQPVLDAGYIIAGMDIVPRDWTGISSEEIVKLALDEIDNGGGNVILLHDGGLNREASVKAVPILIRELRARGYEFTTLADLLGTTNEALMPRSEDNWLIFDRLSFDFLNVSWLSLQGVFWVVLVIGIARMLGILVLAHLRRRARPIESDYRPKVTVVIPAYNEEKVIAKCIGSVLANDYDNFDVVVVDDGSRDETFQEVLKFRNNPRVHIFAQLNQGKWAALNAAIENTTSEVIVCIDADTEIHPEAIGHLARQFANPRIGAVAGKIRVGNRNTLLTKLQALEYITAQNFDRRAFDLVNGILVVPGAIGAWRVEAVREAGRYCNDTMTEDTDLTIAVNRAGYRVTYEERALAYTEAPETVRQLLAQRLRWSLGMFQCAWKHKGAIREGRSIGLISIPDMLIFGYLFPLLAPIADVFILILVYQLTAGNWEGEVGVAVSQTPTYLIAAYLVLPLFDLVITAYALRSDERESLGLIWLFPLQRLFYRQLLYFSVFRSVLRAVTGSLAGWGRMRRTGQLYLQPQKSA